MDAGFSVEPETVEVGTVFQFLIAILARNHDPANEITASNGVKDVK